MQLSCMYWERGHFSTTRPVSNFYNTHHYPTNMAMIMTVPWGQCVHHVLYFNDIMISTILDFHFGSDSKKLSLICLSLVSDDFVSRSMQHCSSQQPTQPQSSKWLGFIAAWPLTLSSTTWRLWWTGNSWRTKPFQFLKESSLLPTWLRSCWSSN